MTGRLTNRVALVTGGLGGIGSAIARRFVAEGAFVWLADLESTSSAHVAKAMAQLGDNAAYLKLDVTDENDWRVAADVVRSRGPLHILINNAGIARTGLIMSMPLADWRLSMSVNADGAFVGLQTFVGLLGESGAEQTGWASVINISSILGIVGLPESAAYSASKGAIRMLSKAAAVEFANQDLPIRVNSIHPGFIRTAMTEQGSAAMAGGVDLLAALASRTPMHRIGHAEEIASGALFLASEDSSFITGAELVIDGGWTAQ